jgi:hypothetical protein
MYQNLGEIYAGLERTREKLISKIEALAPESEEWREAGAGWTIREIVEHMSLVEERMVKVTQKLLARAQRDVVPSNGLPPIPAEFFAALETARDRKIQAPELLHPQGGQSLADSLAKLKESRSILADLQAEVEKIDASAPTLPHPAFGDLNIYQWIIIIGLHERRHLAQIERILHGN